MTIVTQSSLKTWRKCRKQSDYKYVQLLRPRAVIRPLTFGSAVHKIVEFQIEGKSPEEAIAVANEKRTQVFASELDKWDEIIADAKMIMDGYFRYYAKDKLKYRVINGKKTEHQFEYPLAKGLTLAGVIDCIPETPDKRVWVGEHKSRGGRIENDSVRTLDLQTMLYTKIAETTLGVKKISGVVWDYIRSKPPTIPDVLKDGSLSKRKIDTLPWVYEAAIKKHGLDRSHYLDVLGVLDENLIGWFRRVYMPVNKSAIEVMVEEATVTAREMHRKLGVDTTRNLTRDCSFCAYERLCTAELMGADSDFIREREYRVDDKPHAELAMDMDPS